MFESRCLVYEVKFKFEINKSEEYEKETNNVPVYEGFEFSKHNHKERLLFQANNFIEIQSNKVKTENINENKRFLNHYFCHTSSKATSQRTMKYLDNIF